MCWTHNQNEKCVIRLKPDKLPHHSLKLEKGFVLNLGRPLQKNNSEPKTDFSKQLNFIPNRNMARNMKIRPGRNPYELVLVQSAQHLQESGSYALNSERKKILTSSQPPLACLLLLLAIFWCHLVNFPSEKSILPYFSSPRGVAISVSFPEARNWKETESGLRRYAILWISVGGKYIFYWIYAANIWDYM